MLRITEIKKEDMKTTPWSGGTTTEIFIYPEGADYASRDFVFRISTASVDAESSDFTALPDFDRLIASINGCITLDHGDGKLIEIEPKETVYAFDGGIKTHCVGKCRDLNLMLKKGAAQGSLEFIKTGVNMVKKVDKDEFVIVYALESGIARLCAADEEDYLVFGAQEECAVFTVRIKESE